ncbi:ATPase, P-type (transporting), HAD superfamily, subfamily IC [Nannocystis exedens]|uniref:ATPase, P-type (Transporting), HAD superfamily, subfamily IC n=1 Tax=Nannocystis exedens TaxID=54 RepID=A0A1I2FQB1_9BACT|nr:cation-translocating P-type ATPase [Nannocystis exedens]PCC74490.1 Calcium-transporting ATPase 1 [Nannocystis exedens]SFF06621.1 ATPase, P-type (transporting), HAD superfamily, subfamily IC [Nannocystis exedens]
MGLFDRLASIPPLRPPSWLRTAVNLFGHRHRRIWTDGVRAHIELRSLDEADFARFADAVEATFEGLGGIEGVRINGLVGRAIVDYDAGVWTPDTLARIVDAIELRLGLHDLPFAEVIPDYPGDREPLLRKAVDLGADAFGVVLGTALRIVDFAPTRAGFDLAALMTVVDNTPRLRKLLVDRLGPAATEVGVGITNAVVQAVGAGPIGLLVDMVVQTVKLRAERSRCAAWGEREAELCGDPQSPARLAPLPARERPTPLPDSIIERYADDALFASLGGFVVGIADTHNLESALTPLFGGLPKAAFYGRTIFAAELGVALGRRRCLVLRNAAVRLLDRVDTLVVDAGALLTDARTMAAVVPAPGVAREPVVHHAGMLFREDDWSSVHVHEDWSIGPPAALAPPDWRGPLRRAVDGWSGDSLLLAHRGEPVAVVHLRPALRRGADALLAAIRHSRLHFVLACDDPALARVLTAHERIAPAHLTDAVDGLQRHGRVVAVLSARDRVALAAADLGLGLALDPREPPWTADILLRDDLADATFLIDACVVARQVAEQSVVLAGVGAALGAALALGGLKKTRPQQVMLATYAASVVALANGLRRAVLLARKPPPPAVDPTPWHRLPPDLVLARLGASLDAGLPDSLAAERRHEPPRLASRPVRLARAVAHEIVNPLTPVLVTGAALSAVTGSFIDAGLISAVFGFNALIGGAERFQAEGAIAALADRERPAVRTLRGGRVRPVPADELVEGDIVELHAGEVVPADCRLLAAEDLEVDESSLTGESLPIAKDPAPSYAAAIADRSSMLYEGTAIAAGVARAVVVAIGPDTEARRGLFALRELSPETGVEARLRKLTESTLPIAGLSGALLVGAGLFRHQDIHTLIDLGISMTIAAVPEGLPLLATVAQLAASRRLSTRGALVRNPRTVEALGRLDVLCADKTGTLTEGQIHLHGLADDQRSAALDDGEPPDWARALLAAALRASPPTNGHLPHPTDRAIVDGGARIGVVPEQGVPGWQRLHEMPFEPGRGYHAVLGVTDAGLRLTVKGAPEVVLRRCDLPEAERAAVLARAEELAGEGLRVLAIAERPASEERDLDDARIDRLRFCGFILLSDPPRASAAEAIARLQEARVDLIMITGDHPRTARRIADQLGLLGGRDVLTGPELEDMSDEALDAALPDIGVIARATPAHKVRIVKALQRAGRVVGMTGDGANDAAAIRLADVGIALGARATLAARDAADLLVVDERIDTIVDAIAEGRAMWSAVRDAVAILTGGNLGEIGFSLVSGLFGGSALNARQLLLVNLLTDVAPTMAIALRPPAPESLRHLLAEGPEVALGEALDRDITLRAITTAGGAGAAWMAAHILPGGRRGASTVGLLALVGSQLGQTLVAGKLSREVLVTGVGSLAVMLAVVETPGLSHLFGCRPLGPIGLGIAAASATTATAASVVGPPLVARVRARLAARRPRPEPPMDVEIRLGKSAA